MQYSPPMHHSRRLGFGMTIDELVNFDGNTPDEVTIEDKSLKEQVKLIAELEHEEKIWSLK
ncbi:MAG: hypothetical protein LAT68_17330 [Cyclobacteriaceae bacterium]|nr:hypothetical protein [Cyclobacteriaceae bacterium]